MTIKSHVFTSIVWQNSSNYSRYIILASCHSGFSVLWNMEELYDNIVAGQEAKRLALVPSADQPFTVTRLPDGCELIEMSYRYDRLVRRSQKIGM